MFPDFAQLPGIRSVSFLFFGEPLPAYFVMLTVAFLVCTWFAVRWAKREKLDHEALIDLALVSVITGVAGARIAHVLFDGFLMDYVHLCTDYTQVAWPITEEECGSEWVAGAWDAGASVCRPTGPDCFAWARFWAGGLTWYGGMIGAVGFALYFLKREGFPQVKALDLAGMILPLGLFFGRLGCFFGGCCFGVHTDAWYGLSFPAWSPASEQQWRQGDLSYPNLESLPVVPTQLLEAGGSLLIALFIIGWLKPRKRFEGQLFCISMALYAALRFALEYLRNDDRGGALMFSTSQWIGIGIVAGCAALWPVLQKASLARAEQLQSAKA